MSFADAQTQKWGAKVAKKSSGGRSRKTKSFPIETPTDMVSDKIEEAEVVAQESSEALSDAAESAIENIEETKDATENAVSEGVEEVSPSQDEAEVELSTDETKEIVLESEASDPEPTPKPVAAPPAQQASGGFIPLLLGGLVAGGIGYAFASFQNDSGGDELTALIAAQDEKIAAQAESVATLGENLEALATSDAVSSLGEAIAANGSQIAELSERIDTNFASLEERVAVIERQPSADGTLQETAIAAFESDMTALRDQIVAQKEELTAQMTAQQEELSEVLSSTRQEAQAIESSAIASARAATARASLAVIQGSLESGAPFGTALADLAGSLDEPVPSALEAVASDGVATLAAIQEMYPESARAALAVARSEGASGEESSGIGSFLRNQFDVRSVEPQEGDSADAVLSRSEAALKEGRLNDALAEVASLPEVARGAMSEWIALAEQRAAAIDAAVTLASQLNVN